MNRLAAVLALLGLFASPSFCQTPASAGKQGPPKMESRSWKVPPEFVPADSKGERDVTEYLKAQGVTFPEGSFASLDAKSYTLVVKNTAENLDLIDTLMNAGCNLNEMGNLAVEVSVFECGQNFSASEEWPTYEKFKSLPSGQVKPVDSVSGMAQSGERIALSHIIRSGDASLPPPPKHGEKKETPEIFKDGESGTVVEIESVMGPDGVTFDAVIDLHLRLANGKASSDYHASGSFVGKIGSPSILNVFPLSNDAGKSLIVIGTVRIVNKCNDFSSR